MPHPSQEFDDLPPELVARLKRGDSSQPIVDPRTDAAVLDRARAYFAGRRERPRLPQRARWASLAAAAAIAVALLVVQPFERARDPDDVDGSGRVDILDAFAVARMPGGDDRSALLAERIVALAPRSDR
jgi:hypothetical protein